MKKLIFLFAAAFLIAASSACSKTGANRSENEVSTAVTNNVDSTLTVQGNCGMCKERIEKAAKSVDGVISAVWNSETKKLEFCYDADKTSPDAVSKSVAKAGYDTEKDLADDKTYSDLPGCCQYRI
jgi:Cu(I)/Ag(I) efflux system membrane fusion protein